MDNCTAGPQYLSIRIDLRLNPEPLSLGSMTITPTPVLRCGDSRWEGVLGRGEAQQGLGLVASFTIIPNFCVGPPSPAQTLALEKGDEHPLLLRNLLQLPDCHGMHL